jgi:hypothetical protein
LFGRSGIPALIACSRLWMAVQKFEQIFDYRHPRINCLQLLVVRYNSGGFLGLKSFLKQAIKIPMKKND